MMKLISLFLVAAIIAPSAPAFAAPKTVTINPANLRSMVVHSNLPVLMELNRVHQAKDSVEIARGNLLPKLDLGAMIGAATGGPGFAIAAVTVLLPFLLPSNWANYYQNRDLFEAQKVSYKLVQLNQYASAYSLYATIVADIDLRDVLLMQYNDFVAIRDWLIGQRKFIGVVPQSDIDSADAQAKLAYANLSAMDELLIKERAALREMLALDIKDTIQFEPTHVPESAAESMELTVAVSKAQSLSLEHAQVVYLDKAAQEVKYAKMFGFMNTPSMNVRGADGTTSFSKLQVGTPFSIGFDYCPTIQLASDNISLMRLRSQELRLQLAQIVEGTHGSVTEAKKQFKAVSEAEQQLVQVYQAQFRKYKLGLADLKLVLDAEKDIAQATAARVKAQLDLDILRITLHRELLADQFAFIPGCSVKRSAQQKDAAWRKQLFRSKSFSLSMDEVCQPAN